MNNNYIELFSRENTFYTACKNTWARSLAAYGGGARYIEKALVKHMSEVEPEYRERLARACYINYPRRVATLITQYVLAKRPEREGASPEYAEDFSRTGLRVDEVMRQFSTVLNVCGVAWIAVDMPEFEGVKTKAEEIQERLRPYCVVLSPLEVPDWAYGADGRLLWVLTAETVIDNSNPWARPQEIRIRKLWTREDVTIVEKNQTTGVQAVRTVKHNLGVVPFVRHTEVDGYGIGENHWYEDVVRISDAIFNAGSEAQMNVVKQMFGLLVVPEDLLDTVKQQNETQQDGGQQTEPLAFTLARSAALFESAEGKGVCRYISPGGVETQTIRAEIDALRRELYSAVGLATRNDNTKLVESAESKAWDWQNIEHYMATRADVLEQCEIQAWTIMHAWNPAISVPTVIYNRNFAILDLKESVATLMSLSSFNQENDDYQREVGKTALAMLNRMRQLPTEKAEKIAREIEDSTPGTDAAEQAELMRQMQMGFRTVQAESEETSQI